MFLWKMLIFGVFTKTVLSANILFITLVASPSHHIWNEVLAGGLVEKGHNVTIIGHNDLKIQSRNCTLLKITGIKEAYEDMSMNDLIYSKQSGIQDMMLLWEYVITFAKLDLNSDALKDLLRYPRDAFDLIVFDVVCGQYLYPLVDYFGNPPLIAVSPFALPPYILETMGSHFYSYIPSNVLLYSDKMTFLQRVHNIIMYAFECYFKNRAFSELYEMSKRRFGEKIVPFDKVEKQIAILLTNYDPVFDYPQPLPPNIIPVGGIHIKRPTKLPDDVKEILDKAKDGVIFFSFGTNVEPSSLAMEKKRIFLDTFSKLKQIVLWKYGGDDLENLPKNVIIRKWYTQSNILGHKNIKLFITHCGGLSSQEAMYYGVPVIGIPLFMDQKNNAAKLESRLLGKRLEMSSLTQDALYKTIQEVLNNPTYKQNMLRISQDYRAQKETALERAIFWVEYVLRRKDLSHLSVQARYMTIFQRENLDIFVFLSMCIIVFLFLLYALLKTIVAKLMFSKTYKVKTN